MHSTSGERGPYRSAAAVNNMSEIGIYIRIYGMEGLRTRTSHAGGGGREGEGDPQHHFYVEENRSRQSALWASALILQ
jgi:hypothetical protein